MASINLKTKLPTPPLVAPIEAANVVAGIASGIAGWVQDQPVAGLLGCGCFWLAALLLLAVRIIQIMGIILSEVSEISGAIPLDRK